MSRLSPFLTLLVALGFMGCSAYQLGGPKLAFNRVEILPVTNATSRTGLNAIIQEKLVSNFDLDPRVKVGPGGAKLTTEVTDYRRDGLTTKSTDAFSFSSYRVSIAVKCTLTGPDGKKVFFRNREFRAVATLQVVGDAAAEERSLAPGLLNDLASQIRDAATTAW